nr:hypothetical protein [Tanacetum cinerariifolium]
DDVESNGEWDTPEYHDTADSGKKKKAKAFTFYRMETKDISKRYDAPCFVNGIDSCSKRRDLLCKFIINPEEDDVEPGVLLRRSFQRLTKDFGDIREIDGLELPPYVCNIGKSFRIKKKPSKNYKMKYDDKGPSLTIIRALTREELSREELKKDLSERIVILNEPRPKTETFKYRDRYKKVFDTILLDKLKLDGELELKEVEANEEMIREYKTIKEKEDIGVFVSPI